MENDIIGSMNEDIMSCIISADDDDDDVEEYYEFYDQDNDENLPISESEAKKLEDLPADNDDDDEEDDEEEDEEENYEFYDMDNDKNPVSEKEVKKLEDLSWFCGDISRHTAEALLLEKEEGTYLVRCSIHKPGNYSLSVRCQDSVKHFTLEYDPSTKSYIFGMEKFEVLEELIQHFYSEPVLEIETGNSVTFKYPYEINVFEPSSPEEKIQSEECGKSLEQDTLPDALSVTFEYPYKKYISEPSSCKEKIQNEERGNSLKDDTVPRSKPDVHTASKKGELKKRGAIHKNWKKRWFVLHENFFEYFKSKESESPIRTIDMREAAHVFKDFTDNKINCFGLALPKRVFFFQADNNIEAKEWIQILQCKIDLYTGEKKSVSAPVTTAESPFSAFPLFKGSIGKSSSF